MTLDDWLKQQEELCEKATKGPWSVYSRGKKRATITIDIGTVPVGHRPCIVDWPGFDSNGLLVQQNNSNADFIASARTSLPLALKIIRALSEEGGRFIREVAEQVLGCHRSTSYQRCTRRFIREFAEQALAQAGKEEEK